MGHWKQWITPFTALDTRYYLNSEMAASPNWTSSGHLRGCSMADTHIKSMSSGICPSIPTIVTEYNGPLEAVDYSIHSVRYEILEQCDGSQSKLDLIRSPTRL
eukprot:scaffold193_cov101-Skeletonema_dohrnii-CCMP3373.AAC.2